MVIYKDSSTLVVGDDAVASSFQVDGFLQGLHCLVVYSVVGDDSC